MLQLSGNNAQLEAVVPDPLMSSHPRRGGPARVFTLVDLRKGDEAILDRIDLPAEDARRLMELGFLPGTRIVAGCRAPGGDPRVFQVDGSEIALRRETARRMVVRIESKRRG
jgi:ferrous iron transport protein A